MHDFIITPLGPRAYALRIKSIIADEEPKLETLKEHNNLVLLSVLGSCVGKNDRHLGYVVLFSGAPAIHHYTRYTSFSYSEPTELRTREMRVLYDDQYVRLARFGVHVFDYLWTCRKRVDEQVQVDVADHASATIFAGAWRDGM